MVAVTFVHAVGNALFKQQRPRPLAIAAVAGPLALPVWAAGSSWALVGATSAVALLLSAAAYHADATYGAPASLCAVFVAAVALWAALDQDDYEHMLAVVAVVSAAAAAWMLAGQRQAPPPEWLLPAAAAVALAAGWVSWLVGSSGLWPPLNTSLAAVALGVVSWVSGH